MIDFLGIAREPVYSPGKVDADRAILDAVAAQLRRDFRVRVVGADDALPDPDPRTTVFAMCQGPRALDALRRWRRNGIRVVNSPAAIENCHRRHMLAALAHQGVPHPESRLIASDQPHALPPWVEGEVWLKRGDVHATDPSDVVQTRGRAAAAAVLAAFRRRRIATALVQRHVDGDVIKFYAVRGRFFTWFAQADASAAPNAAAVSALAALAERGAAALDLEVYGGDCVHDRQGNLWLIDLNDWPSYAPCRSGAAEAIARYLREPARAP